jgi:16S rRNA (cytosine967-C5)-methyltransferase
VSRRGRRHDPARSAAFKILRAVTANGAYANLELARQRGTLNSQDAAFTTELVSGTCRAMGTYDQILVAASGRELRTLQPAVVDILRLGAHQLLNMRVPAHAAISATGDLAALEVGERLVGLVNAILRKVAEHDWPGWLELLGAHEDNLGRIALANYHPRWIAEAFLDLLPLPELIETFEANNTAARPTLVVRPGLAQVSELGGEPARFSPFGAYADGDPGAIPAVTDGRAGVQDEGSQLVALAFSRVEAPAGPWLDLCAGPGGKTAILAGLAAEQGRRLVAAERHPHRAELVAHNLRAYPDDTRPTVITADSTQPPWTPGSFAAVLADVPCTGLGALRRRPESRWRHQPGDVAALNLLQRDLLASAINSVPSGGVVAYVTCSPHEAETAAILAGVTEQVEVLSAPQYLPEVPDAALGDFVQLWPHRHGTDAMFLGLLRRR